VRILGYCDVADHHLGPAMADALSGRIRANGCAPRNSIRPAFVIGAEAPQRPTDRRSPRKRVLVVQSAQHDFARTIAPGVHRRRDSGFRARETKVDHIRLRLPGGTGGYFALF